jgi:hypothetical protein
MTRPSTSEALGGLVKALEAVRDADDAESEYLLALATVKARAALTSWGERLPLREDRELAGNAQHDGYDMWAIGEDPAACVDAILDVVDRSLFSETPPVKEENHG